MDQLSIEIHIFIFNKLKTKYQLKLRSVSKRYNKLDITTLTKNEYTSNFSNVVLLQYPNLTNLCLDYYDNSYDISYNIPINLRILKIKENCGINNSHFTKLLNLTQLSTADYSCCIGNINCLTKLKSLKVGEENIITYSGLTGLTNLEKLTIPFINKNFDFLNKFEKLIYLNIDIKLKYVNLLPLTNLQNLRVYNFGSALLPISLTKLLLYSGENITDLNYLTNLKTLLIYDSESINNDSISNLTNLNTLSIDQTENITNINNLINLTSLDIENINIDSKGFSALTNLTELMYLNTPNTANLNSLTNLMSLNISNSCVIDECISSLTKLKILKANEKCVITNKCFNQFTNLEFLSIIDNTNMTDMNMLISLKTLIAHVSDGLTSKITKHGLSKLTNLTNLDVSNNYSIRNVEHLISLRKLNGYKIRS